ncbi:MAG: hypothetical protein R3D85_16615 [Paracoccaceae bacterium]
MPNHERDEIVALFPQLESRDFPGPVSRYTLKAYEAEALLKSA